MTPQPENLPRYWPWIFWGFGLMAITCWVSSFLHDTPFNYLHTLVHRRGLTPYPILWIGFSVAGATFRALRHQETRLWVARFLLCAAGLPLILGGIGTYERLALGRRACAAMAKHAESPDQLARLEQFRAFTIHAAWDPTKLAVLAAIICLALAILLSLQIENRTKT
jgi:hypothetical protein